LEDWLLLPVLLMEATLAAAEVAGTPLHIMPDARRILPALAMTMDERRIHLVRVDPPGGASL
jgi:hypothetical protein